MNQFIVSNDTEKRGVVEEFDAKADTYESGRLAGWYQAHNDAIAAAMDVSPNDTVLDIGCATGYLIRQTLGAHPDVSAIGLDMSPKMIAVAEREAVPKFNGRARFFCGDWEAPDSALAAVLSTTDIHHITCASVLHYFSDPVVALRSMRDVLAPGCTLFLLERRLEGSLPTQIWHLAHRHLIHDHVAFYGYRALLAMLREAGFAQAEEIQHIKKFFWHNKISTNLTLIKAIR